MGFLKTDYYGNYNATLFMVISSSARSVADFSHFSTEAESILLPATKFNVISNEISTIHKGLAEISLEEIEASPDVERPEKYKTCQFKTNIIEIFLILAVSTTTSKATVTTSKPTTTSKITTTSKTTTTTPKPTTTSATTTTSKPTTTSATTTTSKSTATSKPTATSTTTTTSKPVKTSKATPTSTKKKTLTLTTILQPSSTLASAGLGKR
ncbi:unnamed protein product [Rotaria sp. Silwood1]|nr:unnamed protein product [Rotaria sp. Silwood1]CAF3396063.1 unnamed protein product [Rotaria sp. Silwood1]